MIHRLDNTKLRRFQTVETLLRIPFMTFKVQDQHTFCFLTYLIYFAHLVSASNWFRSLYDISNIVCRKLIHFTIPLLHSGTWFVASHYFNFSITKIAKEDCRIQIADILCFRCTFAKSQFNRFLLEIIPIIDNSSAHTSFFLAKISEENISLFNKIIIIILNPKWFIFLVNICVL